MFAMLRAFLTGGNFRPFFARFGKADGDGLFATRDASALASLSGFQRSLLASFHGALNRLLGAFSVARHCHLLPHFIWTRKIADRVKRVPAVRSRAIRAAYFIAEVESVFCISRACCRCDFSVGTVLVAKSLTASLFPSMDSR